MVINRTEWGTTLGVIGRFEITSPITTELYDTKCYYQLILSITKRENLSLKIFVNVNKSH